MSNKANQESICTNGTLNILQSLQGTENRVGTQMHADTSVAQKAHDLYTLGASSPSCIPPAEQQAAPKAAPSDPDDHQILAITTAYKQGVGKGRQAYGSGKEISNPYGTGYRCDLAGQYGYKEGKEQAERIAKAAPQPTPAPLSEMPHEKRKAIQEGEQIDASDAWFKARHEMLDTLDRRNVFRAGFGSGWNAALAAQGGK